MIEKDWPRSSPHWTHHLESHVLTLEMRSAEQSSPWDVHTIEELNQLFDELAQRADIRVLLIKMGDGTHGELSQSSWSKDLKDERLRTQQALLSIERWRTAQLRVLPQAVVTLCAESCHCTGAALALVEGSDLALASEESAFELTQSQIQLLGTQSFLTRTQAQLVGHHTSPLHPLKVQRLSATEAMQEAWITFALPQSSLHSQSQELIESLKSKDPLALQFTKETLAHCPHMGWDASVSYTAAKFAQIKALQAEAGNSSRAGAIAGFLSGQSKPGLKG